MRLRQRSTMTYFSERYPYSGVLLIVNNAFADGGFAIVGPYASEVWPVGLRTTGMGSAYGFGGLGKVIRPAGGLHSSWVPPTSSTPKASVAALLPRRSLILAAWFALAGARLHFRGNGNEGPHTRND